MEPKEARVLGRSLLVWYRRCRRDLPWRRTRDPYRIWVSEVMLQQTTVQAVIPYYRSFLHRFPTVTALARARLTDVLAVWSGLGYYRRARHLHQAAGRIARSPGGALPCTAEAMADLPGIGRTTAGAILSIAFGAREPVLDGNVSRVLARLFLMRRDPRSAAGRQRLWALARALVEVSPAPGDLNQALMELGATICAPRAPACPRCPLKSRCAARTRGHQDVIPAPRPGRPPVRAGRFLMRRRQGTGLMDGFWEFPSLGGPASGIDGPKLTSLGRIATVRHSITTRRLLVEIHRARLLSEPRESRYRWIGPERIARLPVSSLVPKVLRAAKRGTV